jgi:hypothetical protein
MTIPDHRLTGADRGPTCLFLLSVTLDAPSNESYRDRREAPKPPRRGLPPLQLIMSPRNQTSAKRYVNTPFFFFPTTLNSFSQNLCRFTSNVSRTWSKSIHHAATSNTVPLQPHVARSSVQAVSTLRRRAPGSVAAPRDAAPSLAPPQRAADYL